MTRVLRRIGLLGLLPLSFWAMGFLAGLWDSWWAEPLFQSLDMRLLPPGIYPALPVLLRETAALSYLAYYPAIPAIVLLLWEGEECDRFLKALLAVFLFCLTLAALLPARAPIHAYGLSLPATGPATAMVEWIQGRAGIVGGAFPSTHVAAAWMAAFATGMFLKKTEKAMLGPVFFLIALALSFGAPLTGYHYAVDSAGGFLAAALLGLPLLRWKWKPDPRSPAPARDKSPAKMTPQLDHHLDHRRLYRLPWSLTDNVICWLEPTKKCNIYCEGCYSANNPTSHKTLDQVREDLEVFGRYRISDGISIAGGDPLTHPQIVEIVKMAKEAGYKPILNTNGFALTPELLRELKKAGLVGLTIHVDSRQHRPDKTGNTEKEMNKLRQHFADMVHEAGGLSCAFNSTVYEDTLHETPDILEWAQKNMDKVHVVVFILFRSADVSGEYDYFLDGKPVDMKRLVYASKTGKKAREIDAREIVEVIRKRWPEFQPCAYLNGTEKPDSFKWLLTGRIGTKNRIYGYVGPKFMEMVQAGHHFFTGRYLAYSSPGLLGRAKWFLPAGVFDSGLRRTAKRYLAACLRNPLRIFQRLRYQSVMVIQPVDILPDGRQSMCDGCPDLTVWKGRMVWSCRLEECLKFGGFTQTVPRAASRA